MKVLIKSTIAYVQQEVRRTIAISKARKQTSICYLFTNKLGEKNGYPMYQDNTVILASLGIYAYEPMCAFIPSQKIIVVNDAFTTLTEDTQEALLQHELAHLDLKHQVSPSYALHLFLGVGEGMQIELDADAKALSQGYKMLDALLELGKRVPVITSSRSYKKRIKNLKELSNAV